MTRNLTLWCPTGASLTGIPCSKHELPMLVARSGLQHVCVIPDCDQHVRLQGPYREDQTVTKEDKLKRENEIREFVKKKNASTKSGESNVTPAKKPSTKIPDEANATSGKSKKQLRRENEAKRAAEGNPQKKADKELDQSVKPKKKEKDPNMLSVSQIAADLGLDPKRARAKLRAAAEKGELPPAIKSAEETEGRWALVKRDSKEHKVLVALLGTSKVKAADDEEEEEEEEDDEEDDEE